MPVPFDSLEEEDTPGEVAWMRFVEEDDGRGISAALFETSVEGEPLSFCFTRVGVPDPSGSERRESRQTALSSLATSLFRATPSSPALVFGLASEIPATVFTDDLRVGLPFCRVKLADPVKAAQFVNSRYPGPDDDHRQQFDWATTQPSERSQARRILDEIVERCDPFEPFQRAAEGLAEAFADRNVQALTSVSRLKTVVCLSPPLGRPRNPAAPTSAVHESSAATSQESRSDLDLAGRLWAALAVPPRPSQSGWDIELDWPGELMPFQKEGVRALLEIDRLLLADDMGLGKTLQAIVAMRILRRRGDIRSCLVVAPASLLDQWRREISKWAPDLSAIIIRGLAADRSWQWAAERDVTLVSYDTLRSDFGDNLQSPIRRRNWDVVVADEAQRIKNRNETSHALKGLRRVRSWGLTGTPIENSEEELASIMEFVDHDGSAPLKYYQPGPGLLQRHGELQLRRRKHDVLDDLPPKLETKLMIDLHPSQRTSYRKAEEEGIIYLKSLGAEVSITHVLELITRLKQICNADPMTGESSKLNDIKGRLEQLTAQGHKALVFSQYTNELSGVAAATSYLREFNPLTLTGDTPQQERVSVIDRFKSHDEHKVLALSLRAGGLGLNLQEASYVFHLDRWWNPAVERQAEDRTHRIGQTVKVNVIKYSCIATIEERIDQILERKQILFDRLIDDVSMDLSAQMSREELFGLFGLG